MGDPAKCRILRRRSGCQIKSGIEVGGKGGIANAWLAEGGYGGIVAQDLKFQGGDCGDGATEAVADEDEGVVGVVF